MITLLYLAITAVCFRSSKSENHPSSTYQYPALRLLVLIHGSILTFQAMNMSQVYRSDVLECIALAPLLVYFLSLRRGESNKLTFVLLPLSCLFSLLSMLVSNSALLSPQAALHAPSVFLHIFLAMTGYSSFALATICAFIYLWQSFLLKHHPSAIIISCMPNLRDLNILQWRTLQVGIVLLTFGIGLAKLSPYLWDIPHRWSGKEVLSVVIWGHFVALALLRRKLQLHKDRLAIALLIGLILTLSTFGFMEFAGFQGTVSGAPS